MSPGRSIRLFLVGGTPNELITAEIMNWTGHALTSPRSKLTELVQRPECGRTGIYFLVGPDPENAMRPLVYIGESDDVAKRLRQHNRPENQGCKDFWEKVCLITNKDQNLTKAHVKYLESQLITQAKGAVQRDNLWRLAECNAGSANSRVSGGVAMPNGNKARFQQAITDAMDAFGWVGKFNTQEVCN